VSPNTSNSIAEKRKPVVRSGVKYQTRSLLSVRWTTSRKVLWRVHY